MGFDPKRNKVHCFACGADYNLFDLLALDNNLSSPADALALASERYGDGSAKRSVSFNTSHSYTITNRRGGGGDRRLRPVFFQRRTSFFLLSLRLLYPPERDHLLHPAGPVGGHGHPLPLRLRSQA